MNELLILLEEYEAFIGAIEKLKNISSTEKSRSFCEGYVMGLDLARTELKKVIEALK